MHYGPFEIKRGCKHIFLTAWVDGTKTFEIMLGSFPSARVGHLVYLGDRAGNMVIGTINHLSCVEPLRILLDLYPYESIMPDANSRVETEERINALYSNRRHPTMESRFQIVGVTVLEYRIDKSKGFCGTLMLRCLNCQSFFETKPAHENNHHPLCPTCHQSPIASH